MKVISRLISLLLLVLPLTVSAQHAFTLPLGETVKMSLVIDTPKASISGIFLMQREEQKVVGTVVNEFGIKAFDFEVDANARKVKLLNTISFLNKWYIRRTIASDLKFLFFATLIDGKAVAGKREIVATSGSVTLYNRRRNLTYTFSPLIDNNNQTDNPDCYGPEE